MSALTDRIAADRLDAIEARANAATEGPWRIDVGAEIVDPSFEVVAQVVLDEDNDFIAHARTDVPALVAALRAVMDFADYWEALPPVGGSSAEQWEFDTLRDAGKELRRAIEGALS